MTAAVLGFGGIVAAALLALLGVLRTSLPPAHLADVEGMKTLLDEVRAERDQLRTQLEHCQQRVRHLTGQNGDDNA